MQYEASSFCLAWYKSRPELAIIATLNTSFYLCLLLSTSVSFCTTRSISQTSNGDLHFLAITLGDIGNILITLLAHKCNMTNAPAFILLSLFLFCTLPGSYSIPRVVRQEVGSCPAVPDFRPFDGTCTANDDAGAADTAQLRIGPRGPPGNNRANARVISNTVHAQTADVRNDRNMNELVTFFGQFIDHDLALSPMTGADFDVEIAEDDPVLGGQISAVPLSRSAVVDGAPLNEVTSFLDGSAIYGSGDERAEVLRTGTDGLLKTGDGDLLPDNDGTIENDPDMSAQFFVAGDIRSNENPILTSVHTLFLREHNIIARELAEALPALAEDEEELFLTARRINVAQLQKVVYEEWLPAILGDNTDIPAFTGFDESVEPIVSNFFSTAAFRVGHTMLNEEITRLNAANQPLPPLGLAEAFMSPQLVRDDGIEPFIRGILNTATQEIDPMVVDSVRNFLFANIAEEFPNVDGVDLVARNIQRGRDHRIPSYNAARRALGLSRMRRISDISSNSTVVEALEEVYRNVNQIDAFVGCLAEDRVAGSSLGELLRASWAQEFTRLRDGDRFFYLNEGFFSEELMELPRVERIFDTGVSTMREIILETTDITEGQIPDNVFFTN